MLRRTTRALTVTCRVRACSPRATRKLAERPRPKVLDRDDDATRHPACLFGCPQRLIDEALAARIAARADAAWANANSIVAGFHEALARCARPSNIRRFRVAAHRKPRSHIVRCMAKLLKSKRQRPDRPSRTSRLLSCRPALPNFRHHSPFIAASTQMQLTTGSEHA